MRMVYYLTTCASCQEGGCAHSLQASVDGAQCSRLGSQVTAAWRLNDAKQQKCRQYCPHLEAGQYSGVLQDGICGSAGITPFHLAVFLPDAQPVALLLCASLGAHHWFTCLTQDDHTPADFAVRCGKHSLSHAISKSSWEQASAERAGCSEIPEDWESTVLKETKPVHCEQPQSSASTCTGCWSDSSSDDSGSDLDASQHGGSVMSVMPTQQQSYLLLSAATNFVRDSKERLADVIRKRWSPY